MDERIQAAAQRAMAEKVFPGCVVGVLKKGRHELAFFGRHTYDPGSPAVTGNTLYDCASITKSIPTATLALQLIDDGEIALETKLIDIVPEYATKYRDEVTLWHLLTCTLGNVTPLSRAGGTPEGIFASVCHEETQAPGSIFSYSNTPAFLLGIVLERVMGMPLDTAAQTALFVPIGMGYTTFRPHGAAPTEEGIQDIVHDESARVFSRAHRVVGHAGLFSTAPDLLICMQRLLANPDERISTNQIPGLGASTGLGWELNQPHFMGTRRTPHTFGKTGFTGCSIVGDFERATALVILSNRTYPQRPKDASAINAFRNAVCDIVLA